jgi:hypothetical protein
MSRFCEPPMAAPERRGDPSARPSRFRCAVECAGGPHPFTPLPVGEGKKRKTRASSLPSPTGRGGGGEGRSQVAPLINQFARLGVLHRSSIERVLARGLAAVICALALIGCSGSGPAISSPSGAGEATAYEEQHHHVPPYKPHDLRSGVQSLRERCATLGEQRAHQDAPEFASQLGEATDIAGWLPELAADSDLGRAEWDRVNEASKRLADSIEKLVKADSDDAVKRARQQIDGSLQSIDDVIHRNAEAFQPLPWSGGDTHHNHHAD